VQGLGDVGMIRAKALSRNRQRALVERLGLGVLALGAVELARLTRLWATSGWSERDFSRIASARLWSGSAPRICLGVVHNAARLFRLAAHVG